MVLSRVLYQLQLHIYTFSLPFLAIICVFRMVYFFAYPSGTWESNQLANFVVFELPTFIYFTAASIILYAISRPIRLLAATYASVAFVCSVLFVVLIWLLFIATVVAEHFLADTSSSSACPGRIPYDTSSISQQVRTLSLVYQSLIILFILLQTLLFMFYIFNLLKVSTLAPLKNVLISSLTIVTGLIARSLLFIIYLAVDFVSTYYVFFTLLCVEIFVFVILTCYWSYIRYYQFQDAAPGSRSRSKFTPSGKYSGASSSSPKSSSHTS